MQGESGHDQLQDLGVLIANPVIVGRRQSDLEAETPEEFRRSPELLTQHLKGRRSRRQLGHEQRERERQLTGGDPAGHVLE
jgi:hypothetical protein